MLRVVTQSTKICMYKMTKLRLIYPNITAEHPCSGSPLTKLMPATIVYSAGPSLVAARNRHMCSHEYVIAGVLDAVRSLPVCRGSATDCG